MNNNLDIQKKPISGKRKSVASVFLDDIQNEWSDAKDLHEGAPWLTKLRETSLKSFITQGLPNQNLERWKYTPLQTSLKNIPMRYSKSDVEYDDPNSLIQPLGNVLKDAPKWFIDIQSRSPAGEKKYFDMPLWHMANAFNRDGLLIHVDEEQVYKDPIYIYIKGHNDTIFIPRTLFKLEKDSEVTIVEFHQGQGQYWNNRLTQIILEPGSRLNHIRVQDNDSASVYTQNTHVQLQEGSVYEAFTLTLGSKLSRNQIHTELLGQHAQCNLYGVNLLGADQIGDTTITVDHIAPECRSEQFYRSVLGGSSRGIYQGKVFVDKLAQKTDGYQLSNALILNEGAEMNSKPELEIYADDVKCSHGSTSGMLDDEQLFYLRSRGVPADQARSLLIKAFVMEVVERLSDSSIRSLLNEQIDTWLSKLR